MTVQQPIRGQTAVILSSVAATLLLAGPLAAAEPPVKHPNLLLNRDEIEQVKAKVKQHDWAAKLLDRVRQLADSGGHTEKNPRDAALVYVLTGEARYAAAVRRALLGTARRLVPELEKLDIRGNPPIVNAVNFGSWAPSAWAYDLTYDTFSADERREVEQLFRAAARTIIASLKAVPTTPNLVFELHYKVAIIGYCLGDRELIEWGMNDPGHHGPGLGGFYRVLDVNMRDGFFWAEAPVYAMTGTVPGMLALAEAALHYDGTDLYRYVSKKSGGSIKNLIDGYLRLAYALEQTGIEGGSLRLATYGDASTSISTRGVLFDTYLINPVPRGGGDKTPVTLNGELEIAYKRYRDPGYAWLLSLNPRRNGFIDYGNRMIWGLAALTHGEPLPDKLTPPGAPGGVYPQQGVAVLRSNESPRFWTSNSLTALVRLGAAVGHGHKDYFQLMLHGKGRLLYPALTVVNYEPTYLNWNNEGINANTLLVDRQSPRPGPCTTRHDFTPEAKFFAVAGSAFEGVTQTRAFLMTGEYLADVFQAADPQGREHTYDWVLHGLGRLYPGNPAAYRPTETLVPYYWWVGNERGRVTDATWQADWVQKTGGLIPGSQPLSKDYFARGAGVRLTMLGNKGTEVYYGDGPLTDGPPYHRLDGQPEPALPLIVARRRSAMTTFAAVHEPYEKRAALRRVRPLQETAGAIGMAVEADAFSDRVLVGFDPAQETTLRSTDGETFVFRDHCYLRVAGGQVVVRGTVAGFRVKAPEPGRVKVVINGQEQDARADGEFVVFGRAAADKTAPAGTAAAANPAEQQAAAHNYFLPEEVHLKAGGDRETTLHIRCVGAGKLIGKLRLAAAKGITIEPETVDLTELAEGDEKTVRLHVRAAADAANALHAVHIVSADGASVAPGVLPVAVGVVMTEDKRIPLQAGTIVRAPGYTLRLDHSSGVCRYLLDADGHRRHGGTVNGNNGQGFGAVERDGLWLFRYGTPCKYVWDGPNSILLHSESRDQEGNPIRLRYTFGEDQITLALTNRTNPLHDYTIWLGNFDALEKPQFQGTTQRKGKHTALVGDTFFFPHPLHRQGVLVRTPPKTPLVYLGDAVNLPLRVGQEVVFRFATPEEAAGPVKEKRSGPK